MSDSESAAGPTAGREAAGRATEGPHDVSLLLGGPFFQLLLRSGLIRPSFDLLLRRVLVLALVPWAPLLVLTLAAGTAVGDAVRVPFLLDIEVHVRFLVVVPLLVLAEREIHDRLRPVFTRFLERDLLAPPEAARFDAILVGARRWRNSYVAEALMILASFGLTPLLWSGHIALDVTTWYRPVGEAGSNLAPAGIWFAWVAIPLLRFLVLRWLYRLVLLFVALARIACLPLRIVPTHPDGAGGLSFLAGVGFALRPFHLAITALVSGFIANKLVHEGQELPVYYALIASVLGVLFLFTFLPMLFFGPALSRARRRGLAEYGALGQRYAVEFHRKWVLEGPATREPLLGSADIQSLADLSTGFEIVRSMRTVPFGLRPALQLIATAALPFVPLLLTIFSLETLLKRALDLLL